MTVHQKVNTNQKYTIIIKHLGGRKMTRFEDSLGNTGEPVSQKKKEKKKNNGGMGWE